MPTIQRGPRGTNDLLEDLVVQEMMKKVAVLETSTKPITTLLNKLEKALPTDTPEPQHTEDELMPSVDSVDGVHTAADPTIAVNNPAFYLPGDMILFPRVGEIARVTTAPGTSPITVSRGFGTAPPAALRDDEVIWILGPAIEEGASSRDALNTLEIPFTSNCQIMRNSIEGTGTQLATRQLGGDFEDQAEKKLIEHKKNMEYFFKFGQQTRQTVNGEFLRALGGLIDRIQINRFAVDGVLNEGVFEAAMDMAFSFGSAKKFLIAGPRVFRAVSNFARNRMVTVPLDESYGLAIKEYTTASGNVLWMCSDRELKGSIFGGYGIVFDPDYAVIRYLRAGPESKRPQKYQGSMYCKRIENIQANDADRRKDEYFSELTLQLIHERVHMLFTGVQG